MKHTDFKPCAGCRKGVMHNGIPLFYKVTVQSMAIDKRAVERQHGLELIVGNPALAHVMGPDEDMASPIGEQSTILVCQECSTQPKFLAALIAGWENSHD